MKSQFYKGQGPEIVWVGEGAEVCALGYESDKYRFIKTGQWDVIAMGVRMGFLLPKVDDMGNPLAVLELYKPESNGSLTSLASPKEIALSDQRGVQGLQERWQEYLFQNTGIRSLARGELNWTPSDYPISNDLNTFLPEPMIRLFETLGFKVLKKNELEKMKAERFQQELLEMLGFSKEQCAFFHEMFSSSKVFEVTLLGALKEPFPFKLDIAAPPPRGWKEQSIGLTKKEVLGMNWPIVMAHEIVYRALLHACLHPAQVSLPDLLPMHQLGLYLGTGIGPHDEHEQMVVDTLDGKPAGAKALANCIANVASGYISARFGIKGKISTHVGACESCMGSIADCYRDIKSGHMKAGIAGGYEDVLTPSAYNGFSSNMAFSTNEKIVENVFSMLKEGVIKNAKIESAIKEIQNKNAEMTNQIKELDDRLKNEKINYFEYQLQKRKLKEEKRKLFLMLPKEIACLSSMPFAKYRSGFVMGVGAGCGFFTTLDFAIEHGLPIRAYVSGASEMVPDSMQEGAFSIAALGDGVGDAYERAFLDSKGNYHGCEGGKARDLKIEDIGVWFAHGTSTPQNGWGERKEIHRINQKYSRNSSSPILITGDKDVVGHRIGGNFPSLVGYIFENNEVLPLSNYLQAGFAPKGRRGFGEPLDELFPSTRVVGKAGEGKGQPLSYHGDFIAVNGAGFGRINSVLIFRRFKLEEVELKASEKENYQKKLTENVKRREKIREKILFGQEPLVR